MERGYIEWLIEQDKLQCMWGQYTACAVQYALHPKKADYPDKPLFKDKLEDMLLTEEEREAKAMAEELRKMEQWAFTTRSHGLEDTKV